MIFYAISIFLKFLVNYHINCKSNKLIIDREASLNSARDRDFQEEKGGMMGLTGKNERESGISEPYCGPSQIASVFYACVIFQ